VGFVLSPLRGLKWDTHVSHTQKVNAAPKGLLFQGILGGVACLKKTYRIEDDLGSEKGRGERENCV
jgi:hypothetical protein